MMRTLPDTSILKFSMARSEWATPHSWMHWRALKAAFLVPLSLNSSAVRAFPASSKARKARPPIVAPIAIKEGITDSCSEVWDVGYQAWCQGLSLDLWFDSLVSLTTVPPSAHAIDVMVRIHADLKIPELLDAGQLIDKGFCQTWLLCQVIHLHVHRHAGELTRIRLHLNEG